MKKEKQIIVNDIISTGRYKEVNGEIYSFRKNNWMKLKPNKLNTGYHQLKIFNGKRGYNGLSAVVYVHQLVYMLNFGIYQDGFEIDHINRNRLDNKINNLRAVDTKSNNKNRDNPVRNEKLKPIRSNEIKLIRLMLDQNFSHTYIANELNLNRLSVRYIANKIKNNQSLKYE